MYCSVCRKDHDPEAKFYVSMVYDRSTKLLCGPYDTHKEALVRLPAARELVCAMDARGAFAAFGTLSFVAENYPKGKLALDNSLIPW